MDLTLAELIAALPDGEVKTWWTDAADLPVTAGMNEFFMKTLKGLHDAARAKNAAITTGSRIDGYPAPTYGTVTLDSASGIQSLVVTSTIRSRVALNPDLAVSTLI